jgi:hypothetical protein
MSIRGFQLAAIVLLSAIGPTVARAQYGAEQCTSLLERLTRSLSKSNAK